MDNHHIHVAEDNLPDRILLVSDLANQAYLSTFQADHHLICLSLRPDHNSMSGHILVADLEDTVAPEDIVDLASIAGLENTDLVGILDFANN